MKTCSMFTIIELLMVIAIITILASILMPSLNKARNVSKAISCISNLKQLAISMNYYQNDNQEYFVPHSQLRGNTIYWTNFFIDDKYTSGKNMLCPSVANSYGAEYIKNTLAHNSDARTFPDYGYNSFHLADAPGGTKTAPLTIMKSSQVKRPSQVICMADDYEISKSYYSCGSWYLRPYYSATSLGQFDARHQKAVNASWADGHAAAKRCRFVQGPYDSYDLSPYSELVQFLVP